MSQVIVSEVKSTVMVNPLSLPGSILFCFLRKGIYLKKKLLLNQINNLSLVYCSVTGVLKFLVF